VASLHSARGDPDQAIQAAKASLPLAQESGNGRALGHALFVLVDAYTAKQDLTAAEQAYRDAIRLAEQLPDYEMLSQARQGYGDFLAKQARFQEAYQVLALVDANSDAPARG
jgi:tetratricopeptide (TPR) repeat protein